MRWDMDEHYFSADPSVPFKRAPVRATVWGHDLELTSGSGVFAQGRLDIGTAVLFRETEPPGGGPGPRPRLRVRRDRAGGRGGRARAPWSPRSTSTSVRCCSPTRTPPRLGVADRYTASTPDGVRRGRGVRRDLVEPAHPDRQGGPARAAADLAAPTGPGRPRGDGGRQEPRGRLAAAVAGGAGLPDRADSPAPRGSGCWRAAARADSPAPGSGARGCGHDLRSRREPLRHRRHRHGVPLHRAQRAEAARALARAVAELR